MVPCEKKDGRYVYTTPDAQEESFFSSSEIARDDADLIAVIEEFGAAICSDKFARLRIVQIPEDVKWHIAEYDGVEWVAEDHRTWHGGEED